MFTYIIRRLLLSIPVLFGILFATFALARLIPGDPCRAMLGEKATKVVCDEFIHRHGLDKPIAIQFGVYVNEIAHGDFGRSFRYSKPVTDLLMERLPITVELSFAALLISIIVGIPLGVISAVRHNSWVDVLTMLWANIGVSMPVFWLGLMLAYFFALTLKGTPFQLPPSGRLTAVEMTAEEPAVVLAAPAALKRALVHLIFNAIQALDDTGGTVQVQVTREADEARCEIIDDGCGMSADVVKQSRELFFTTRPGSGKGLGLSLAEAILRQHGGDLQMRSSPGCGTTVSIYLPLVRE